MKAKIILAVSLFVGGLAYAIALEKVAEESLFIGLVLMMCGLGVGCFHVACSRALRIIEALYYLVLGLVLQSMMQKECQLRVLWLAHLMIAAGVYLAVRFVVLKCRKKHACEPCTDHAQQLAMQQIRSLFTNTSTTNTGRIVWGDDLCVLYFSLTDLPLCYEDRLCVFTSEEAARTALKKTIFMPALREAITIRTFEKSEWHRVWDECHMVGLEKAVVNGRVLVTLSQLPRYVTREEAVPLLMPSVTLCNNMMQLQQRVFCERCDPHPETDGNAALLFKKRLGGLLLHCTVWVGREVETEQGRFLALYTDACVARGEKDVSLTQEDVLPVLNRVYRDPSLTGVVINPWREHWVIPKTEWSSVFAGGMSFETE